MRVRRSVVTLTAFAVLSLESLCAPVGLADPRPADPQPLAPGEVLRVGAVAGTGTPTSEYGLGATDLCEFMAFTGGMLQVCGDSFAGQGVGYGGWYSPVALRVDTESIGEISGVRHTGILGTDRPLLADPPPPGFSQLPAGVVDINGANYLFIATTKNLVPQSTRLVRPDPFREGWPTVPGSVRQGDYAGGQQTQISGYYDPLWTPESPRGWGYIVADGFDRTRPAVLYRAKPDAFTDRSSWQGWGVDAQGKGAWNRTPTPLFPDRLGELSMKMVDGKTVLSYFNGTTGNVEVRVAGHPTRLGQAPATTVVTGGDWPEEASELPDPSDNTLGQPYGGYIGPNSTLDRLSIYVSQWNTASREHAPYRVIEFAVNPTRRDPD
jgi:hypothetical protein